MISISFSPDTVTELRYQRFHHPHPRVQQKMEALLLKSAALPHGLIADIVGVCPNTLRNYFQEFKEGGVERLKELRFYQPQSALKSESARLEDYFEKNPPATVKEAAATIEQLTGIKRGLSQVRGFLKTLGLIRRKVGALPSKADPIKQEAFLKEKLEPRLQEAMEGKREVYFVDAAHFVLAPFLGFLWSVKRIFIPAPSGRRRFNVLGALHAVTHELVTITNDAYINAQSVCELIRGISQRSAGIPITLVLDNARYQKCFLVQNLAAELGIELLFLPPYSPNLNLIERLWKFTKKKCLNSKYHENFGLFSSAISNFLVTMHIQHKSELKTLLTHRFQVFNDIPLKMTG
jgi:transposase